MHVPTGADDSFILSSIQPDNRHNRQGLAQWQVPMCAHQQFPPAGILSHTNLPL